MNDLKKKSSFNPKPIMRWISLVGLLILSFRLANSGLLAGIHLFVFLFCLTVVVIHLINIAGLMKLKKPMILCLKIFLLLNVLLGMAGITAHALARITVIQPLFFTCLMIMGLAGTPSVQTPNDLDDPQIKPRL